MMNLYRRILQGKKELEAQTGIKVGYWVYRNNRQKWVLFCVHEIDDRYAAWIGCGRTVREAKKDFLMELNRYRTSAVLPSLLLCQTVEPQYLPAKAGE